jgi:hypothetical protein
VAEYVNSNERLPTPGTTVMLRLKSGRELPATFGGHSWLADDGTGQIFFVSDTAWALLAAAPAARQ